MAPMSLWRTLGSPCRLHLQRRGPRVPALSRRTTSRASYGRRVQRAGGGGRPKAQDGTLRGERLPLLPQFARSSTRGASWWSSAGRRGCRIKVGGGGDIHNEDGRRNGDPSAARRINLGDTPVVGQTDNERPSSRTQATPTGECASGDLERGSRRGWVRAPTLCVRKTPREDTPAARLLVVRSERLAKLLGTLASVGDRARSVVPTLRRRLPSAPGGSR
jgi:hypothetical protein